MLGLIDRLKAFDIDDNKWMITWKWLFVTNIVAANYLHAIIECQKHSYRNYFTIETFTPLVIQRKKFLSRQ